MMRLVPWFRPYIPVIPQWDIVLSACPHEAKLMSVLTQDQRFVEPLAVEGDRPKDMCELLDRVEAKGIKKGIEQGIAQGIEQGIQQGTDETRIESIKNLMKNLHMTPAEAMDALGLSASDQVKYASSLGVSAEE